MTPALRVLMFLINCEEQSLETVSTNHNLSEEKGEPKRYWTVVFCLPALPLGQIKAAHKFLKSTFSVISRALSVLHTHVFIWRATADRRAHPISSNHLCCHDVYWPKSYIRYPRHLILPRTKHYHVTVNSLPFTAVVTSKSAIAPPTGERQYSCSVPRIYKVFNESQTRLQIARHMEPMVICLRKSCFMQLMGANCAFNI